MKRFGGRHTLSIIVPTRNEGENVALLAARIGKSLERVDYEVIFVDDSDDGETVSTLERLSQTDAHVRFRHRPVSNGLSGAVIDGFGLARGDILAAMDGDLQHPTNCLLPMLEEIVGGADLVVASRFVPGGDDGGLRVERKVVSFVARALIWVGLGKSRILRDPTSGYFMVRRDCVETAKLHAIGWKILLEVLARGGARRVAEVPMRFEPRIHGTSKLSGRQMTALVRQVFQLVKDSPEDRRFYLFALVGLSGVVLNTVVFLLLTRFGVMVELASIFSALAAMVSNFALNDHFTFFDRKVGRFTSRGVRAVGTQVVGLAVDVGMVVLLHGAMHWPGVVANLFGIVAGAVWNYGVYSRWVWKDLPRFAQGRQRTVHEVSESL